MKLSTLLKCTPSVIGCLLVAAALMGAYRVGAAEATRSTSSVVRARLSAAMTGLTRFRMSGSVNELSRASGDLRLSLNHSDLVALSPSDLLNLRRQYVSNYTELLSAIEGLEDPAFVATDDRYRPVICFLPPPEPNGHQAMPCADPSEIVDPATRAAYVAALQANADRTKRINRQRELRDVDHLITSEFRLVLQEFRGRVPDDTSALDAIVSGANIRAARKSAIHSMY